MNQEELQILLDKYFQDIATPEEEKILNEWYLTQLNPTEFAPIMGLEDRDKLKEETLSKLRKELQEENTTYPSVHRVHFLRFTFFRYAAAIILIVGIGAYLYKSQLNKGDISKVEANVLDDIAPGTQRAILTLADGTSINLDNAKDGEIADQGNARILKSGGQVIYNDMLSKKSIPVSWNTMKTPRGGQYLLVLPDGTKVWLNAESSLTYPTSFTETHRTVMLKGEAYFEVSKNKKKPFHVRVNEMEVEVLGTHFNINSYDDESDINTTLLEGSVRVKKNGENLLLKPGQQAQINNSGKQSKVVSANINQVMAWKNGSFSFENADLATVLRQIGRWYNVEIIYPKNTPSMEFEGEIGRTLTLSQVLKILEQSEVNFKIESGRRLIVMPK